ncbi:MAG: S41 family peptidase [Caldilineaceae bacterium]
MTASVDDFVTQLNARRGEGVVLDLRGNAGGSLAAMLTVAAYFYGPDAPLAAGTVQVQRFDPASGTWRTAPLGARRADRTGAVATFTGPLAVLVDDACAGACELLAALLQSSGRGTIVAQTGTAGVAGERADVLLPAASSSPTRGKRYAVGAPLADGAIHWRGGGARRACHITQESETAKSTGNDPLLYAALDYLTLVQLEPVPVTFDFVGVTSVGAAAGI